ncbi:hypothetical protein AYO44_13265 [Planctomycetaceae bacterium SCGC AG-212-F19]|nr:hypothetical protein AYO44_13265 [Planctomycetaceae bacterium SCGC AG-212-F19]
MFAIHDKPARLCDGISRRELLRVGGLSALGLSLPSLLAGRTHAAGVKPLDAMFGRAKNVIFLWLQGGPSQHETFDPKPDALAEVRGEFAPIATNVPGIMISELLPRCAAMADKYAIVRSMCTHTDLHDASGYWVLTGYKYTGQQSRQITPADWPYFGSVIKMLKPSTKLPAYSSVWLPDVMRLNDNVQPAGQTAGFLGKRWEPERVFCDPSGPHFKMEGLALPAEVPPLRLTDRQSLLAQVERHLSALERDPVLRDYDRHMQNAFGVLTGGKAHAAFDIAREPPKVRERYGRGKWGQCVLLARRLIEAGARLVHVNWPRETGDSAIDNPMWDTHAQDADRMQDVLCPQFDITYSALIEDLAQRGLLGETLVVAIGEFGRTPKFNANGGRDHWGHVFSFLLAGAGISGGQVYGSSDKQGAYPHTGKMEPQDLTATIFHLLGIGGTDAIHDRAGRPLHLTTGSPIPVLGDRPATDKRVAPAGTLTIVPGFSDEFLFNAGFEDDTPLAKCGSARRLKGWQATPLADAATSPNFGVRLMRGPDALPHTGTQHVAMGYGLPGGANGGKLIQGSRAVLAQEVRNPRAGKYTFTVHASGGGTATSYREVFQKHFTCRLVIYGYTDLAKDATKVREFGSVAFQPPFADAKSGAYEKFTVSAVLRSQDGGAFELTKGIGVAVVVEKTAPGDFDLTVVAAPGFIRIDDVSVEFAARPRNDEVQV